MAAFGQEEGRHRDCQDSCLGVVRKARPRERKQVFIRHSSFTPAAVATACAFNVSAALYFQPLLSTLSFLGQVPRRARPHWEGRRCRPAFRAWLVPERFPTKSAFHLHKLPLHLVPRHAQRLPLSTSQPGAAANLGLAVLKRADPGGKVGVAEASLCLL